MFWKRGLFKDGHVLENLERLQIAWSVENNGETDNFLEILEKLEIPRESSSEKTPFVMTYLDSRRLYCRTPEK